MQSASTSPAYTAAPWVLDEVDMTIAADEGKRAICSVYFSDASGHQMEDHGNARLIAAAPNLLQAVADARDWFADQQDQDDEAYGSMIRLLDKAITIAIGE